MEANETFGNSVSNFFIASRSQLGGVLLPLSMSNLVGGVVRGSVSTTKIPSLPVVKTRTKKLEEAEREKRNRKQQQKQRQDAGGASSTSSSFQANDGSREGRKAERDRRRAEHNAAHNVKPKTPEELAEMERKRRLRMEDEAAKWNMRPEDAPEEGDLRYEDVFESDEDTTILEGGDDGDEDEEDVIDLD